MARIMKVITTIILQKEKLKKKNVVKRQMYQKTKQNLNQADNTLFHKSYKYSTTGKNQYKKTCMNDEGRPTKKSFITFNDNKKPISINEQYTVTWITQNRQV